MADQAPRFIIEPLSTSHDRALFVCGVEPLDRYFRQQATQDVRRRMASCFVAAERTTGAIVGFYTIAGSSLPLSEISPALARKLPRYPMLPATRIGRLAVAESSRGLKIGTGLLIDAAVRASQSEVMAYAVVVDAKDEAAVAFYEHHGFIRFQSVAMSLYLPLSDALSRLGH